MSLDQDFRDNEAIKRAQNEIKKQRYEAEQYCLNLRKEAEADELAAKEVLDKARKEGRQIINKAKDEIAEKERRNENIERQIRADRLKLQETTDSQIAERRELEAKAASVKALEAQAQADIAMAQRIKAEAQHTQNVLNSRLNETVAIWQRSM